MGGSPRILATGASGFLGGYVVAELRGRGCEVVTAGRRDADLALELTDPDSVAAAAAAAAPEIVVHVAAAASIAACARDPRLADRVNALAVEALAGLDGVRLVQVSTDLVFDGRNAPYLATAAPRPLSVYGRSKLGGERAALANPRAVVVRLPLLFGPSQDGRRGATDMLRGGARLALFVDEFRTPLHVADAARAIADFALARELTGCVHAAGPERVSRWELARRYAAIHRIEAPSWWPAVSTSPDRPRDVSLLSDWTCGRSLDAALASA